MKNSTTSYAITVDEEELRIVDVTAIRSAWGFSTPAYVDQVSAMDVGASINLFSDPKVSVKRIS